MFFNLFHFQSAMKAFLLVVLAVFGLALSIPLEDQPEVEITPFADGDIDYRLNEDILPVRYDLEFTPYFANVTFQKVNLDAKKFNLFPPGNCQWSCEN